MVLIGHVGFATNRTANGTKTSLGGAGYATAVAASALLMGQVGLVAQVGQDFDFAALSRLNLDMAGVSAVPGASARFYIHQFDDGTRSFMSELGVATTPASTYSLRLTSGRSMYIWARRGPASNWPG